MNCKIVCTCTNCCISDDQKVVFPRYYYILKGTDKYNEQNHSKLVLILF